MASSVFDELRIVSVFSCAFWGLPRGFRLGQRRAIMAVQGLSQAELPVFKRFRVHYRLRGVLGPTGYLSSCSLHSYEAWH